MRYLACAPVLGKLTTLNFVKKASLLILDLRTKQIIANGGRIIAWQPAQGSVLFEFPQNDIPKLQIPKSFEVKGKPFINDIPSTLSSTISVSPELSREKMYDLFRPYGLLTSVTSSSATFKLRKSALAAAACMHRVKLSDANGLHSSGNSNELLDVRVDAGPGMIRKLLLWLSERPKIVFPLLFAASAASVYAVFEPIREAGVRTRLFINTNLSSSPTVFSNALNDSDGDGIDDNIEDDAKILKQWFFEGPDTFITVAGPPGSGKRQLTSVLGTPALDIEGLSFQNLSLDECLKPLARAVGYHPLFQGAMAMIRALEVAIGGVAGLPPSLAMNSKDQIQKILQTVTKALAKTAEKNESRPLIVLRDYTVDDEFCTLLTEWLASLIEMRIAKVLIVSNDRQYQRGLQRVLPTKALRSLEIGDIPPLSALNYVRMQYGKLARTPKAKQAFQFLDTHESESLKLISKLGGRVGDLDSFAKRLVGGESVQTALNSVIKDSAVTLTQMVFNSNQKWTPEQAWTVIKMLAQEPKIGILNLLNSPVFNNDLSALLALEKSEILSLTRENGRIVCVKPARPVYHYSFIKLVADENLKTQMDIETAKLRVAQLNEVIKNYELELERLSIALQILQTSELLARFRFLSTKIGEADGQLQQCLKVISRGM